MDITALRIDLTDERPEPAPSFKTAVAGLLFLLTCRLVAERVLDERERA